MNKVMLYAKPLPASSYKSKPLVELLCATKLRIRSTEVNLRYSDVMQLWPFHFLHASHTWISTRTEVRPNGTRADVNVWNEHAEKVTIRKHYAEHVTFTWSHVWDNWVLKNKPIWFPGFPVSISLQVQTGKQCNSSSKATCSIEWHMFHRVAQISIPMSQTPATAARAWTWA